MFFFQAENRSDIGALLLFFLLPLLFFTPFLGRFGFISRGGWWPVVLVSPPPTPKRELGWGGEGRWWASSKVKNTGTEKPVSMVHPREDTLILAAKMPYFSFPVDAGNAEMPSGVGVSHILNMKNSIYHLIWMAWDMGVWSVCVCWGEVEGGKG